MITALVLPNELSFSANPVYFELQTDSDEMRVIAVTISGRTFTFSAYPFKISTDAWKIAFDISDIIRQNISYSYDASLTHQIDLPGFLNEYTVSVGTEYEFIGQAVPGGVSKQFLQYMKEMDTNPFQFRFLNQIEPFFWITRTDSDLLILSRTELACLFFMAPEAGNLTLTANTGETLVMNFAERWTPAMVNLAVWVQSLEDPTAVNAIAFNMAGVNMYRVEIRESNTENSYLIKYRNSLDVFEFLEVTGEATLSPEMDGKENYNVFNVDNQSYSARNLRRTSTEKLTVETGYKSPQILRAVTDLLLSDQVWFIDGMSKRRCIVTSDANQYSLKSTTPETIALSIQFAESDQRYTPVAEVHDITYILGTEDGDIITTENGNMIGV